MHLRTLLAACLVAFLATGCNHSPEQPQHTETLTGRSSAATPEVEEDTPQLKPETETGVDDAAKQAGPPPRPDINIYSRTCTADTDCVVVNGHGMCGCPNLCASAIHKDEVPRFEADLKSMPCGDYVDPGCKAADACPMAEGAYCAEGRCKVRYGRR